MTERIHVPAVGAQDPEHRNSPIIEESDEFVEDLERQLDDDPLVCYYNGVAYQPGDYVCSGDELLCCRNGAWLQEGSCDPDNP